MVVPYTNGLSESFKNICNKHGIQVYFNRGRTIKNLLVVPKDRDTITQKGGVVYRYKCAEVGVYEEYISESARTFGERFEEHLKAPSPIYDYCNITVHPTTVDTTIPSAQSWHIICHTVQHVLYNIYEKMRTVNNNGYTNCQSKTSGIPSTTQLHCSV